MIKARKKKVRIDVRSSPCGTALRGVERFVDENGFGD